MLCANIAYLGTRPVDGKLSVEQLCEIVGISHQRREGWAGRGLVRSLDKTGGGLTDAIELAAVKALVESLRRDDVMVAWTQIQPELSERVPGAVLDVVFDLQSRAAQIAHSDEEVVAAVRVDRPVRVVSLGQPIRDAIEAFRRLANPGPAPYQPATNPPQNVRAASGKRQTPGA